MLKQPMLLRRGISRY